jgi:hypothetical protein
MKNPRLEPGAGFHKVVTVRNDGLISRPNDLRTLKLALDGLGYPLAAFELLLAKLARSSS